MSKQQRREFLLEGTRTAKLAVPRADGTPHVVPVWFVLDGDDIVFTTGSDTVKGRSLRRDGRVALCTYLDEMLLWATAIGGRYMGAERAEEFGRRNAVSGELLVRVAPTRVIARTAVSD